MAHWHSFPDTMTRPSQVWFSLPSSRAGVVSLGDYLDRGSLCLLLLPGSAARWIAPLEALARAQGELAGKDAAAVAVSTLGVRGAGRLVEDMGLPMVLLCDEAGATWRRYASLLPVEAGVAPLVFILDRFGAPRAAAFLKPDDGDDWVRQALDWVDLADLACPE